MYKIPDQISFEDAATFPTCYLTAHHALFETGKLQEGETVIIHAAGSGVGVAAIQLAKNAGATVFATAGSDEKCEKALGLGASNAMNNREGDLAGWARELTQGAGVDMVMDCVGTALFGASLFAIGVHGRLVNCGNASGDEATIPSLGYLFHSGISIIGSNRSGIFLHLMPIFSTILAIMIFDEKFMIYHLIGAILIITGIILSSRKKNG